MNDVAHARRERAADVGMWLFLASLAMFFASLYSGYVLLRAGSETWDAPWAYLRFWAQSRSFDVLVQCALLTAAGLYAGAAARRDVATEPDARARVRESVLATIMGGTFAAFVIVDARSLFVRGHAPASSVAVASWFVLAGTVVTLAIGGVVASYWIVARGPADSLAVRLRHLARYWWFLSLCWLAVVLGMYVL